ncbi:undecaprenyl-phosphate glucose phosphotransferase [Halomonas sp. M4R1S46]|uniref:undecaprenyl-phosphate glucose phosphotransferase n=1 Tax=Halomonas sp. M4R1S46 TaxID=2982692 RepID=UPI0021E4FCBA|nr:undecaprenyl-phosphate glucose phosphotransferase [Halomonas sp. M4R1S46]UYG06051.1 undecaprenyl-phosphate glucose phosphotransferase [Halomonas sp. M4R1S46]
MEMTVTRGRARSLSHHRWLISFTARLADITSTLLAGNAAYFGYFSDWHPSDQYLWGMMVGALLVAAVLPNLGVYRTWRGRLLSPLLFKLMMGYAIVGVICTSLLYLSGLGDDFSRVWLVSWFVLAFMGSLTARAMTYPVINRFRLHGRNRRQVVLVGDAHSCATAAEHLHREPTSGFDIGKIYLVGKDTMSELADMRLSWESYAAEQVHDIDTDEVWICLPISRGSQVKEIIADLGVTAANVRFMPDMRDFRLINHDICNVASLYLLNMSCSPIAGSARWLKAVEDRIISALILLMISPIMLALAIGVKLSSPGPVFYRQERVSWNGKPFNMLKFRSMPVDSEKNGVQWGGSQKKTTTKFGAFIRKTSLDELPQFINVLLGDMSIVGPRPERTVFVDHFKHEIPGYMQKHLMKAGITGWAQINGWRGDTDLEKRIECDLWYIEHWSVMLDLKIIFLTIFKGFINKHAY